VALRSKYGEVETVPYDQLLLAIGSVSRVLPVPGLAEHAVGFKSLADAIWLRNHVVETLEEANATDDPARRDLLLSYVFIGGGYAGLEALAELQDFASDAIESYPRARLHGMRWVLVEASDRVLPEIDPCWPPMRWVSFAAAVSTSASRRRLIGLTQTAPCSPAGRRCRPVP